MNNLQYKILNLINSNKCISHIDVLNTIHSKDVTYSDVEQTIRTLIRNKYIHPTSYNDLSASRYSITPKGKEILLNHQEQSRHYSEQKEETTKTNHRNFLLKFIGAIVMYLFGLFTPEIKEVIISIFEFLF